MFDADRPITSIKQDKLNRGTFARHLARSLLEHKETDSLVVGLYGGWGVGKTSLLNLIHEELNNAGNNSLDEEKPILLNFSAWSYSGQEDLTYYFFRRVSSALRHSPYVENKEDIISLLELYISYFTHKPIPSSLQKKSIWQRWFSKPDQAHGWESGRDLTLVKAELNTLLRSQKHKIVISIDNISRLYPQEIKELFQMVKSIGDFANTAYLLALDKPAVIAALDKTGEDGERFLEKIVQLPFEVPPILQQDIEGIFAEKMRDVMQQMPEGTWNAEYWSDIYYHSLKYFFHHCRDITRYVNTLNFGYPRLRDTVNPVDYFALTAIEVFLPKLYAGIYANKDLFTDLLDHVFTLTPEQIAIEKNRCDDVIKLEDHPSDNILELLMRLFPRIRKLYEPNNVFYHSDALAQKNKRLCCPDFFDLYFKLSIQNNALPQSEFDSILKLSAHEKDFDQALTRLNQDNRILKFLDLLDGKALKEISIHHIPAIIDTLLDDGDLFPNGIAGLLSMDTPMRIHQIIHQLLRRYDNTEERFAVMQNAIAHASKSLYIIVHELNQLSREHQELEDTFVPMEFRDLLPNQLDALKQLAVVQIENWARTDRLIGHPQLLAILKAWRDWGGSIQCNAFLQRVIQTDKGLLSFLTALLAEPIQNAMTKYEKNPEWIVYLEEPDVYRMAKEVEMRAKTIFEHPDFEKLRESEQLALMIFLDLMKTQTKKEFPRTVV
jgi:predicted KAP-like P-loop ATPase